MLGQFKINHASLDLASDDAYKISCRSDEATESFHICSASLGLCPYAWDESLGLMPPKFASYYSGLRVTTSADTVSCSRR